MVRLSLVNLYLHGFTDPHISEYDTLTSEDNWNQYSDIIMANPPFMSPKGGIKPHKRFSVQAKRSEVLFVDYIAEHLTPNGRAAVIVPEGIIFQSQNAYKQLRKMLVENYLYAVVSLPAGIFQPYSGVKTSILLMDKALAKKCDSILFVKIENDCFDLGAQRRKIDKNDLPQALQILRDFHHGVHEDNEEGAGTIPCACPNALIVKKEKIAGNGEWNLSGERYRETDELRNTNYEIVNLGDVTEVTSGQSPEGKFYNESGDGIPFYQGKTEFTDKFIGEPIKWTTKSTKLAEKNDILMSVRAPVGPINYATQRICIGRGLASIRVNKEIENVFLFNYLKNIQGKIKGSGGAVFDSISRNQIQQIKIPLPPIEIQQEIVAEIEGYQKIIDGARAVVENYKPQIQIDPKWKIVTLGEVCNLLGGGTPSKQEKSYWKNGTIKWISSKHINENGEITGCDFITEKAVDCSSTKVIQKNATIAITRVSVGKVAFTDDEYAINQDLTGIVPKQGKQINQKYLFFSVRELGPIIDKNAQGIGVRGVTRNFLSELEFPLPPLKMQKQIVTQIEKEQALVNANKEIITLFEQKTKDKIASVWREDATAKEEVPA